MRRFCVGVVTLFTFLAGVPVAPAQLSSDGNEIWNQGSNGVPGNFESNDFFGLEMAVGDFDDDGWDDLAIASPFESGSRGIVHVIYGGPTGLSSVGVQQWEQGAGGLDGNAEGGDAFGLALAVGDFNGDGYKDLAIGVPGEDSSRGAVEVLFGSTAGLTSNGHQTWTGDTRDVPGNGEQGDQFGAELAAGDFNNDSYDDLAIGVPGEDNSAGQFIVLPGNPGGLVTTGSERYRQGSDGIQGDREPGDLFGWAMAAGDINNDGFIDLVVSTPGENSARGRIYVIRGSAGGLDSRASRRWQQGGDGLPGDTESNDAFGDVVAVGDFDGDGFYDVAVGATGENSGRGDVTVIRGSTGGLTAAGAQRWRQGEGGLPDDDEGGDRLGGALIAGDFDQDGFYDLAIGARGEDNNRGMVHVLHGSGGLLTATGNQEWRQGENGLLDEREGGDDFGDMLAAGNFGRDAAYDLAIGAPREDGDRGIVHVLYGVSSQTIPAPAISAVVGAGLSVPPVEDVSQNGIVTLFGSNFFPADTSRSVTGADLVNGRLPTTLGGVCVEADGIRIPLFAIFPGQINAQADNISLATDIPFQVITECGAFGEQRSNVFAVPAAPATPQFFFFVQNPDGRNPVAAVNATRGGLVGEPGLIPGASFARALPGDVVTVFMTGLGETMPRFGAGELPNAAAEVVLPVRGTLGGFDLVFSYVGVTPGNAGLYQANFPIPGGLVPGDYELVLELGDPSSANVTPAGGFLSVGP